jgi:hypothetical protein
VGARAGARARRGRREAELESLPAFTSIGSYPLVYLTDDDEVLCPACASSAKHTGKDVRGDVHWEGDALDCDECGVSMPSAYGPVDKRT